MYILSKKSFELRDVYCTIIIPIKYHIQCATFFSFITLIVISTLTSLDPHGFCLACPGLFFCLASLVSPRYLPPEFSTHRPFSTKEWFCTVYIFMLSSPNISLKSLKWCKVNLVYTGQSSNIIPGTSNEKRKILQD